MKQAMHVGERMYHRLLMLAAALTVRPTVSE